MSTPDKDNTWLAVARGQGLRLRRLVKFLELVERTDNREFATAWKRCYRNLMARALHEQKASIERCLEILEGMR